MRRLFKYSLCLALICFGASDATAQQAFPYSLDKDCYKLIELEGFKLDETAVEWDLTRTRATGVERPLTFKMLNDTTFTATTDNARQTFQVSSNRWHLLKSEAMTSVADLKPGVIVKGMGSDTLVMKGRTYQTDYYYGKGTTSHEIVGRGKLIRLPDDTISNVTLDRRSANVNRYKYTAKELITDHSTNLYDYPARLYDPVLGRWLSTDPIQELYYEISSYVFCHNNSIMYVDPDGNTDFLNEVTLDHKYIKDNVNQVIMISNSDYQILASQNFDQTTKEYTNIIARGVPRTDLFSTIENVLEGKAFVPYSSVGDCLKCAMGQNNSAIIGPMYRIDLYNISNNAFNYTEGVEYIKTQLIKGKSVVTGVSYGKMLTI